MFLIKRAVSASKLSVNWFGFLLSFTTIWSQVDKIWKNYMQAWVYIMIEKRLCYDWIYFDMHSPFVFILIRWHGWWIWQRRTTTRTWYKPFSKVLINNKTFDFNYLCVKWHYLLVHIVLRHCFLETRKTGGLGHAVLLSKEMNPM